MKSIPALSALTLAALATLAQAQTPADSQEAKQAAAAQAAQAAQDSASEEPAYEAVMPTVYVRATSENSITKGYIGYEQAEVTRNQLTIKETT